MPYFQDAASDAGQLPGQTPGVTELVPRVRTPRIDMTEELRSAVGWRAFFRTHAAAAEELERPAYRWTERF